MPGPKVFVEALDRAFENVCELDLVFHFDEVCRGQATLRCVETVPGSPHSRGDYPGWSRPGNERRGN